ncbi:MAG: sigma-54 dependent transcriptional regulator [Planctomycetota bacterium]|nr:sigma-54 dependent transcriptional regulator [Planctomycetota bacterium]
MKNDKSGAAEHHILVVDDDADIRVALEMLLQYEGFDVWTAKNGREALARLDAEAKAGERASLVISDVKMPELDGLGLLDALLAKPERPPVVLVSGHADVPMAVEAVRKGAFDFLEKPLDQNRVLPRVRAENRSLKARLGERYRLIGESKAMVELKSSIERAARADAPVLITGENGTGKEVVARNLHLSGPRVTGPFIAVNCAAIPAELIESELFGHVQGSFTGAHADRIGHFEAADGGTLFLDEVGDMPLAAQAKVLRALETREITPVGSTRTVEVDIRVIAATNADLAAAVEAKAFRMDLFYRLNVVPIRVPALREHPTDIPDLADAFLSDMAARWGRAPSALDKDAVALLASLDFPGNVRQLRNLLEGAVVLGDSATITAADLEGILAGGPALATPTASGSSAADPFRASTFEEFKNESEALFFRRKLDANDGNIKRTAEELGMQRSHLYKKLDRYGLRG